MSNININSLFPRFSKSILLYWLVFLSLSVPNHASTMHVTCGTDIELTCPIHSTKKPTEVISWFRPNSSQTHITFIAIGDILFPEYALIGRFNLISSSSTSRLLISHVSIEDQGTYTCKSSSTGQHSIKLRVDSHPHISPTSPLLLYPVNRTFSITCSLLCDANIDLANLNWLVDDELLTPTDQDFRIDTLSSNTQRLTVHLNKKNSHSFQANYTCRYDGKETTIFVRRRTKEELHRLPRQEGSSVQYLFQTPFDSGQRHDQTFNMTVFLLLFLLIVQ